MKALLSIAVLVASAASHAQAVWPEAAAGNRPAASISPRPARLPADMKVTPVAAPAAQGTAAWSGGWRGWGCGGFQCDVGLVVEQLTGDQATVSFAMAGANVDRAERVPARLVDNGKELEAKLADGSVVNFRLRPDKNLDFLWRQGSDWAAGVLAKDDSTAEQRQRAAQAWMASDAINVSFVQPGATYAVRVRPKAGASDFLLDAADECLRYATPTAMGYADPYLVVEFLPPLRGCNMRLQYRADPISGKAWAFRSDDGGESWRNVTGKGEVIFRR
jgi:hypothetical protein